METELSISEYKVHNIIKNNKIMIGGIIILITFYLSYYINSIEDAVNIIDNSIIKVLIFLFISYYTMDNPTTGMILLIMVLVIFQIVSNLKIKNDINADFTIDKFTLIFKEKEDKIKEKKHLDILKNKNPDLYFKFENTISNYMNYPDLMLAYNKFKINYEKLQTLNLTQEQYYINLIDFYQSKLILLETIFKHKKSTMSKEKVEQITNLINLAKGKGDNQESNKNKEIEEKKNLFEKINKLYEIIE